MKKNIQNKKSELVFILDCSGSMGSFEKATISGYNEMLEKQQKTTGEARLTTVLFNDEERILHDRIPLHGVRPITEEEYITSGCTALLDALGHTLERIADVQKYTAAEEKAEQVIFVIITDGYENSSKIYSYEQIHRLVFQAKEKGWEFIFMGANMDAIAEASRFGIDSSRSVTYYQDNKGIRASYRGMNCLMSQIRCKEASIDDSWKEDIEKYVREKQKKSRKKVK